MKYSKSVFAAVLWLLGATLFAACDKLDDDVQPPKMNQLKVQDDYFTTHKNQGIYLDILANDSIGNLAVIRFVQPQNGTLRTDSIPGRLYYMPAQNFTGTDNFTYQACLNNNCVTAMVSVLVKPDSTQACFVQAHADSVTLVHNIQYTDTISVKVLVNDQYCLTGNIPVPQLMHLPRYGHVTATGSGANFRFIYGTNVPMKNINDKFRYSICQVINGQQVCSEADVTILIR